MFAPVPADSRMTAAVRAGGGRHGLGFRVVTRHVDANARRVTRYHVGEASRFAFSSEECKAGRFAYFSLQPWPQR